MVMKSKVLSVAVVVMVCVCGTSLAQLPHQHLQQQMPKPPPQYPRRDFSWTRMVMDEVVQEKAFVVEHPGTEVAVLVSRDPILGEAGYYTSVSVYDFSAPQPLTALKPYFQGQPCFLLPSTLTDFNTTVTLVAERNGQKVNETGPAMQLTASDMPLSDPDRALLFKSNPMLIRMCASQPIFATMMPDPLAFDPYVGGEVEQLVFSALTLDGSVTITFTWEMMTK